MAIALDAKTTATGTGSTLTWSHTCTGTNLALLVESGLYDAGISGNRVSGVTYNGVAMTRLGEVTRPTDGDSASLWGLKNPATGANNIVITYVGTPGSQNGGAQSFTGVDQTTPFGTGVTTSGAAGSQPTIDVTSTVSGSIVVDSWAEGAGNLLTATGTLHHATANAGESGGSQRKASSGGTVTMNWTGATSTWAIVAAEVFAVAGAAVAGDAPRTAPLLFRLHSTRLNAATLFHPLPATAAVAVTNITVALTGVTGTASVGTLAPSTTLTVTGVVGTAAVGSVTSGTAVAVTGVAATAAVGSLTPSTTITLTGVTATGAVGTVGVINPSVTVTLTSVTGTAGLGTLAPSTTVSVSGNAGTAAVGSLVPSTAISPTGVAGTASVGALVPSTDLGLTGNAGTGAVGTVVYSAAGANLTLALTGVTTGGTGTSGSQIILLLPSGRLAKKITNAIYQEL